MTSLIREDVAHSKVLCVGAGGIGCELLKTLVVTGFDNLEVIDMDTIETSNLNRQFLFRKHHVGMSKALVAAESVRKFRPNAKLVAHHSNIKEARFGIEFFKQFSVVLNGLDNLEARKHVNRLCLAAEVPLVESGTQGYLGQVTVHSKGHSECFECQPKQPPKTFPICTIRNHPDRPIHCVVWGKELLFPRLFGKPEEVSDLDTDAQQDGADGEAVGAYARRVFKRLFQQDIESLQGMTEMWEKRTPPSVLDLEQLVPEGSAQAPSPPALSASAGLGLKDTHKVWSLAESARVFLESIRKFHDDRPGAVGTAIFDKDDNLAVDFVAAASNLRAANFGLALQSWFDIKGMAGNIIHAIATTNAIISGLIVIEAIKVLSGKMSRARDTYCVQYPTSMRKMLVPVQPAPPNPKCYVCSKANVVLELDTTSFTLGTLVDKVVKRAMGVNVPMLFTDSGFLYDEGAEEKSEICTNVRNRAKVLVDLPGGGLKDNVQVSVNDDSQEFECTITLKHSTDFDKEQLLPEAFRLKGEIPTASTEPADTTATKEDADNTITSVDDDVEILEEENAEQSTKKRKRADDDKEDDIVIL